MKTFTFDLKNPFDLLEIAKNLGENNINVGDKVVLQIAASTNMEFNISITKMFNEPYMFCEFIDACRTAVTGKIHSKLYVQPKNLSINKSAAELARCLTENTKINFTFERIGNHHNYYLPKSNSIKEISDSVMTFIISKSVMPGDSVTLNIVSNELDYFTKLFYFHTISTAVKISAEINNIPAINIDLLDYTFSQGENFNLTERLSQSGVNFTLNYGSKSIS